MKLLGRESPTLGDNGPAIPAVQINALDGAVVFVGHAHVGPVDVPLLDIDHDTVRVAAVRHQGLLIGAIRVGAEDPVAAEVENEECHG
jgi:hypothetical protein